MAFTQAEAADLRRFCGYGVQGSAANPASGYRYFASYGVLEYRIGACSDAEAAVARGLLDTLRGLEAAIASASEGLDTAEAGGWKRNGAELDERLRLYRWQRRELCRFLGVPEGPALACGSRLEV
jgi:hypothetical protein